MLGEVVVNDQRVHAVVHEPFTHRGAGEWGEVLIGGGIGGRGRHDDRVGHGIGLLEHGDDPRNIGLLLPDGHVDAVERAVVLVAGLLGGAIQAGLADDRIDAQRRLARGPIADDEFPLPAPDGNHGVHRHNARLDRLAHGLALDDARGDFLHRVGRVALNRSFAVQGPAQGIDYAAQQALAHRHLQELARRPNLVAFLDLRIVAQDDGAYVGFLEIQRQPNDAFAEIEHLVQHRIGQTFNPRDAVADLADDADILAGGGGLDAGDLGFNFL